MTSVVEICNQALSHIRAGGINSLTEASFVAQQCALHYAPTRDWLLEDHAWQFAKQTRPLSLLQLTTNEWEYIYAYPSDTIKVNYLMPLQDYSGVSGLNAANSFLSIYGTTEPERFSRVQIPYQILNINGTKVIATNLSEAVISYQRVVEDPEAYSRAFVQALAYLLSSKLAVSIVGAEKGAALRQELISFYNMYRENAINNDLNEQFAYVPDSEYITVR